MKLAEPLDDIRVLVSDDCDQSLRWRPGERMHDVLDEIAALHADRTALDLGDHVVTFGQVAAKARGLARHLDDHGVRAGDRVALLLSDPEEYLPAMLAVSRLGASYVPLDVDFPIERIAYICADAAVRAVLSTLALGPSIAHALDAPVIDTSAVEASVDDGRELLTLPPARADDPAYVIYTSGTTGRPKGVSVGQAAICNFLRVAAETYGYRSDDRVYLGMSVAFDFSIEESWVPWLAGATLVPRPAGGALVGDDLTDFVRIRAISALCCVPTLLATLDEAMLKQLRLVIVSGEACPQDLVRRWHQHDRRMLNVYGPTETTVTATWSELHPDRPVSLGRPLPTYTIVLLDPDAPALAGPGDCGEIGIAGPGLALGYLNRDDLTARAFVDDFVNLEHNPSGRIYRTGDLGAVSSDGQLTYLGRIDSQVKIRGYRIELTEIESVLLTVPGVAAAAVNTWMSPEGVVELVAYYTARSAGRPVDETQVITRLRELLPPYMVPGWFELLDRIPLTTSDKIDRAALPPPTGTRRVLGGYEPPETATEVALAAALAEALGLAEASVTADIFADLGANSLLLARFCAASRDVGLSVPIRDIYLHPTIRALSTLIDEHSASTSRRGVREVAVSTPPAHRASTLAYALTGAFQLTALAGYAWLLAAGATLGYDLLDSTTGGWLGWGQRLTCVAVAIIAVNVLLPIGLKWSLIGRWRPGHIELWSIPYLRFWVVKTALRASVMGQLAGTPLYSAYLRALGARVGARALVLTRQLPVCADLIEIGADAVIGRDALLLGYRAETGRLALGRIRIGERAFIGENAVLDIDTAVGDDAELAWASALPRGGQIPVAEVWHGSPAVPAPDGTRYRGQVGQVPPPRLPRIALGIAVQVVTWIAATVTFLGLDVALFDPADHLALLPAGLVLAAACAVLLLVTVSVSLIAAAASSQLARLVLRTGVTYPIASVRHSMLRVIDRMGNRPFLVTLFGDSSLITGYQAFIGWSLGRVEQTGSNFGTAHRQDIAGLTAVGRGTMISDGLSVANVCWSSTGFRTDRVTIGQHAFMGNKVVYPAGARLGDNVLLATKVLVPVDGPTRHDVGLLGSPAFAIPRSPHGEHVLDLPRSELNARLAAKRRHNLGSMGLLLLVRWLELVLLGGNALVIAHAYRTLGPTAVALGSVAAVPVDLLLLVTAERCVRRWKPLEPVTCSISELTFWRHERLWKLLAAHLAVLDRTPMKAPVLRLLGVRVGRRLFDDGAAMPEHTMVEIGDDCTLGARSTIQCHSLEDGRFTCDRTRIGSGVTLGAGSFVHFGVELGDQVVVAPDSFVMKGTQAAARSHWHGNPAVPFD